MSQRGRNYAILIGSSQFDPKSGLKDLRCPLNDVRGMAETLASSEFGLFAEKDLHRFENKTHYDILPKIEAVFAESKEEDLILFYYSGHGECDSRDRLYLATADSRKHLLTSTWLPTERLRRMIDHHRRNRVVIILDCCYSAAVKHDFLSRGDGQDLPIHDLASGIYVITASSAVETAVENIMDEHGLLTKHLLEGICLGKAKSNGDGLISARNIYDYVAAEVSKAGSQRPRFFGLEQHGGELFIARAFKSYRKERLRDYTEKIKGVEEYLPAVVFITAYQKIVENQQKRDKPFFDLLESLCEGELRVGEFCDQWLRLTPENVFNAFANVQEQSFPLDDKSTSEPLAKPESSMENVEVDDTIVTEIDKEKVARTAEEMVAGAVRKVSKSQAYYRLPSTNMLTPSAARPELAEADLLERARQLAEICQAFNVSGQVKQISPGPVVTTFEFKPDPGIKYSRITSLADDFCIALKVESIRIERIPGKSTVGIEVPNDKREIIRLREVIESKKFRESESKLTLALGKTIDGANYSADLTKMPHLLIAGATGSGKSVALNSIVLSLLFKATPEEVKLILVDPKRLELGLYADLPHLLTPIVTDPKRAGDALKWAVTEMENRYKHLGQFGVRNIEQYNQEICDVALKNDECAPQPLPFIVIVIDELADLMMTAAREVEENITRLAQMARAAGIHLVLATQRPSVDVITGLIKANFPSRISFRVSSKVDSRTIIDTNGAEGLLGQGDMLFLGPGTSRLIRVHGAYVDEKEVKRICDFIRSQGSPAYIETIFMSEKQSEESSNGDFQKDEKYDDAVQIVLKSQKASTSLLQRHLRIGYGRAASIIDMMEREGIVGPEDGIKPREVLVKSLDLL